MIDLHGIPPAVPIGLAVLAGLYVWYKLQIFLLKLVLALVAVGWLLFRGYDWLMQSDYSKTDAEVQLQQGLPESWKR